MRIYGSDESHWEGNINWHEAVDYLPFTYYKATDGMYFIDAELGDNHDGCDEVGLPHAPFHWWQELQDPIIQADHFCDTIEEVGDGYKQLIVDVEPKVIASSIKLKQLLDRIENRRGKKPAIYTSKHYWDDYIRPLPSWANQYDLLCAHYKYGLNPSLPYGWTTSKLKVWQFTDKFWFPGCNEIADGNWFYGTLQECRDWFGNYHPYEQPPTPPSPEKTQLVCLVDGLRIRTQPNTSAPIVGSLNQGDIVEIDDVGGTNAWVKHSKGWSAYYYGGIKYLEPR